LRKPQDEGNMTEEEETKVTEKDPLERYRFKPVVRGTFHDAETESETIEKNDVVNGVESSTEVERKKKSGEPIKSTA